MKDSAALSADWRTSHYYQYYEYSAQRKWVHNVHRHYAGTKCFHHPMVGPLELTFIQMELDADTGLTLAVYPAVPGSSTEEALKLLATWAATENVAESDVQSVDRTDTSHR